MRTVKEPAIDWQHTTPVSRGIGTAATRLRGPDMAPACTSCRRRARRLPGATLLLAILSETRAALAARSAGMGSDLAGALAAGLRCSSGRRCSLAGSNGLAR